MSAIRQPARRTLLVRAIQALGALITAALGLPALAYLFTPGRRPSSGAWIEAARLDDLAHRAPAEVALRTTRVDGWKVVNEKSTVWLVRLGETDVAAYAPQCTHLGCAYHYNGSLREFVCPCHATNFSLEGKVLSGPAPRPLDRYDVRLENGKVLIGALRSPAESGG